jgi:hypothetical protein
MHEQGLVMEALMEPRNRIGRGAGAFASERHTAWLASVIYDPMYIAYTVGDTPIYTPLQRSYTLAPFYEAQCTANSGSRG